MSFIVKFCFPCFNWNLFLLEYHLFRLGYSAFIVWCLSRTKLLPDWTIWITRWVSYKVQEVITVREHLDYSHQPPGVLWGPCCSTFLVFCEFFLSLCLFVCLRSVFCASCCLCFWLSHFWLTLRISLTFIYLGLIGLLGN